MARARPPASINLGRRPPSRGCQRCPDSTRAARGWERPSDNVPVTVTLEVMIKYILAITDVP